MPFDDHQVLFPSPHSSMTCSRTAHIRQWRASALLRLQQRWARRAHLNTSGVVKGSTRQQVDQSSAADLKQTPALLLMHTTGLLYSNTEHPYQPSRHTCNACARSISKNLSARFITPSLAALYTARLSFSTQEQDVCAASTARTQHQQHARR